LNKALLLGLDVCLVDKLLDCLRHEDDVVSAPHGISALRASLSHAELLLEPDETLNALKDQVEDYEKREKDFLSLFSPLVEGNKEFKQREAARQVDGVLRELQALLPSASLGPIYDVGQILSQTVEEMDKPFVRAAHVLSLWLQCPTSWMQRFRDDLHKHPTQTLFDPKKTSDWDIARWLYVAVAYSPFVLVRKGCVNSTRLQDVYLDAQQLNGWKPAKSLHYRLYCRFAWRLMLQIALTGKADVGACLQSIARFRPKVGCTPAVFCQSFETVYGNLVVGQISCHPK